MGSLMSRLVASVVRGAHVCVQAGPQARELIRNRDKSAISRTSSMARPRVASRASSGSSGPSAPPAVVPSRSRRLGAAFPSFSSAFVEHSWAVLQNSATLPAAGRRAPRVSIRPRRRLAGVGRTASTVLGPQPARTDRPVALAGLARPGALLADVHRWTLPLITIASAGRPQPRPVVPRSPTSGTRARQ